MSDEEEELVIQDSPLHLYMKEHGVLGFKDLTVVQADLDQTNLESGLNHHNEPLLSNRGEHQTEKKAVIKALLESSALLDEHHNYLQAFLNSFHSHLLEDKTRAQSPTEFYSLLLPCICTGAGLLYATLTKHASIASKTVTTAAVVISAAAGYAVMASMWEKLKDEGVLYVVKLKLQVIAEALKVWHDFQQHYQEVILVSQGAVLINKYGNSRSLKDGHIMGDLRRSAYLYVTESLALLQTDLNMMQDCVKQCHFTVTSYTTANVEDPIDFKNLQNLNGYMQLMTSEWIMLLVLAATHLPMPELETLVGNLSALKSPHLFVIQLKFHKALLDGELETMVVRCKTDKQPCSDQSMALHSLYLHAREVLRLSKLCLKEEVLTDIMYTNVSQQLSDCTVCLDRASKTAKPGTRSHPQPNEKRELTDTSTKSYNPVRSADTDWPIIDQVFVMEPGDNGDATESHLSCFGDDNEEELKSLYEKYLMRELRGVVNELAQERLARESAATSSEKMSEEELAQITRNIIENRDIKAIIRSAAENVVSERLDASKIVKDKPFMNKPTYTYKESDDDVINPVNVSNMKSVAAQVAQRFQNTKKQSEDTFGTESDSD